jgi:hypothetical protein
MIDPENKLQIRGTQICKRGVGEVSINSEQYMLYFYNPVQFTNHAVTILSKQFILSLVSSCLQSEIHKLLGGIRNKTGGVEELDTPNETPVIKYTVYCTALLMNPFNF